MYIRALFLQVLKRMTEYPVASTAVHLLMGVVAHFNVKKRVLVRKSNILIS